MSITDRNQGCGSRIQLPLELFRSSAGQEHGDVIHGVFSRDAAAFGERQELLGACQLRICHDVPYGRLGVGTLVDRAKQRRGGQAGYRDHEAFHGA
jgi:hypothetical protein